MARTLVIVVVVAILGLGAFLIINNDDDINTTINEETTTTTTETSPTEPGRTTSDQREADLIISYTDDGFVPANAGPIRVGDTVLFTNDSSRELWVASDVHPTHEENPEFDQNSAIVPGESWEYTFSKTGEWSYHNHEHESDTGIITVEE